MKITSGVWRTLALPVCLAATLSLGSAAELNPAALVHLNDRYIVVLQGTWWVGTGPKFDPEHGTVAMPEGSFVTHYGKQVHWDGAKDEDAVLLIMGEGPATATTVAEEK